MGLKRGFPFLKFPALICDSDKGEGGNKIPKREDEACIHVKRGRHGSKEGGKEADRKSEADMSEREDRSGRKSRPPRPSNERGAGVKSRGRRRF